MKHKQPLLRSSMLLVVLVVLAGAGSFFRAAHVDAAALTWDGGGGDNNWSTCANWTTDTCPVAGDTVTFNSTSTKASTIDGAWGGTITGITITTGYSGTITLARSLTLSGAYSQSTGTFDAASYAVDMNSTFTLSGGVYTASSGTTTLAGAMTISGSPTFSANGGTWTFDGTTTASLSCNNVTFNLVTFNHDTNAGKTVNSNCSLPLGNNPSIGTGISQDLTLNGTLTGTGTLTIGAKNASNLLTLNSGGVLSGFTGLDAGSFTVAGGTYDFSMYTSLFAVSSAYSQTAGTVTLPDGADFNSTFTVSSGATLNASSGTTNFASNFTLNAGAIFSHNNGTLDFDGASAGLITCNGAAIYNTTFTHTSNFTKTVGSTCALPLGNNPTLGGDSTADVTLNGTVTGAGIMTIGTKASGNVLTISSTGSITGFSGMDLGALTVSGGTYDFGSYSLFSVAQAYSQTAGTVTLPDNADFNSTFAVSGSSVINAPAGTVTFASTFTLSAGITFNHGGGTIAFDGTGAATITCNNATFNHVAFNHTSSAKTVSSGCTLPLGNNPTIGTGNQPDLTLSGTLSGTGTLSFANKTIQNVLTLAAGGAFSGFTSVDAGVVTQSASTNYDLSALDEFHVRSTYTLNAATLTAPAEMYFYAAVTINASATFNHNSGSVIFTGTTFGTTNINCGNVAFNLVVLNNSSSRTFTNCTLTLGNDPVVTANNSRLGSGAKITGTGTLDLGLGWLYIDANGVTVEGFDDWSVGELDISDNVTFNLSDVSTVFLSELVLNSNSTLSQGTSELFIGSFISTNGDSIFQGGSGDLTIYNPVVLAGDSFTTSSGTNRFRDGFNRAAGTLTDGGGTLEIVDEENPDSSTFNCGAGGLTFGDVVFNRTAGSLSIANNCTFNVGANPTLNVGPALTLAGNLTGSGDLTMNGNVKLSSTTTLTGFSTLTTDDLTIGVNGIATTPDLSAFSNVTVEGDLTIADDGTLNAPALMNVAGDISIESGGAFNANGGTIVMNGTDQAINGDMTFYDLSKEVTSAATLTFEQSKQVTVTNDLTLKGADNELLELVSSTPDTAWLIAATGSKDIDYVSVTDSTNTDSEVINAYHSYDGGNNTNWNFVDPNPNPPDDDDNTPTDSTTDEDTTITYDTGVGASPEPPKENESDRGTEEVVAVDDGQTDFGVDTQEEPAASTRRLTISLPKIGLGVAVGGSLLWLLILAGRKLFPKPPIPPVAE